MMGGLLNISHLIQDQPLHREISFFYVTSDAKHGWAQPLYGVTQTNWYSMSATPTQI